MSAYYNEHDPFAAAWLRQLIKWRLIADGEVDERSIVDVRVSDLVGFRQCHFFAGIGGWSYALRLAGCGDDRECWTGSCPCQPLSSAGKRKGHADERHLWPAFHRLIAEFRPATCFGEQVDSNDGREWLSAVRADLEGDGYAVGAAGMPACGVGAPHIRQRLWWVAQRLADAAGARRDEAGEHGGREASQAPRSAEHGIGPEGGAGLRPERDDAGSPSTIRGLADDDRSGPSSRQRDSAPAGYGLPVAADRSAGDGCGPTNGFWRDADWLHCRDGKWRPVEPGTFPLVAGLPKGVVRGGDHGEPIDALRTAEARVGRLRGYGNAIVPEIAATFIQACEGLISEGG